MTTKSTLLAVALALLAAGCIHAAGKKGGLPEEEVAQLPADVRASYELFSQKCSRCHTLSRPLNAQVNNFAHWKAYVNRMRRQAGSGISPKDGERILVFLRYFTEQEQKAEAADD